MPANKPDQMCSPISAFHNGRSSTLPATIESDQACLTTEAAPLLSDSDQESFGDNSSECSLASNNTLVNDGTPAINPAEDLLDKVSFEDIDLQGNLEFWTGDLSLSCCGKVRSMRDRGNATILHGDAEEMLKSSVEKYLSKASQQRQIHI